MHRSWLYKLLARYRAEGEAGLEPARAGRGRSPTRIAGRCEDEIVALRKQLSDDGLDAGAVTIQYHLARRPRRRCRRCSTIWRVLKRRGFVIPQPHKRPKSSFIRFEAELPNECWQADVTHWTLADGTASRSLNIIDDHSRLCVASRALRSPSAADVVRHLRTGPPHTWGYPASVLTDNGAIFTAAPRRQGGHGDRAARPGHRLQALPALPPPDLRQGRALPPDAKKFLAKPDPAATKKQLQAPARPLRRLLQPSRPHRALGRRTPPRFRRPRSRPIPGPPLDPAGHFRVRHDNVDNTGSVTLRHEGRLHHIGIGRAYNGRRVVLLVAGLDVRIITDDGELIRQLTLDPTHDYQPMPNDADVYDVSRHLSPMSRDITRVEVEGFEPSSPGPSMGLLRAQPTD